VERDAKGERIENRGLNFRSLRHTDQGPRILEWVAGFTEDVNHVRLAVRAERVPRAFRDFQMNGEDAAAKITRRDSIVVGRHGRWGLSRGRCHAEAGEQPCGKAETANAIPSQC
jgi:hypothetical protein